MKGLKFKSNNSIKTKSIILSVISIIELIILLTTMAFAWFEGLTSLEIKGNNLSTANGLKSKFIVGEGDEYSATNENNGIAQLNEFFHKQSFDKLSPVSSLDGDNFYAITTGTAPSNQADYIEAAQKGDITFRKLSDEEKLSSIVYFQFELKAASSDTDFWFKTHPTVKIGNNTLKEENNPFRFSIDDGSGATRNQEGNYIFTTRKAQPTNNQYIRAVSGIDANGKATLTSTTNIITNLADSCVFGTAANNDGQYKLFTVEKDKTKIITVAIWIEAFDPAYNEDIIPPGSSVEINMEFRSSWDVVDKMVFRDFTSDQWVDTVDEDQSNKAMKFGAANLDSPVNYYYPFKYDSANKQWTANVPRAVQKIEFIWQGTDDKDHKDNVWNLKDSPRGSEKVFTVFGSTAGVWYDGGVDFITFSDYTGRKWVGNSIDGAAPKMKAQVTYNNTIMSYSMTDEAFKDSVGRSVWSMYMPTSVDNVVFNRCSRSDTNQAVNTWEAPDRNGETRYYALDGGEEIVVKGTAIYLSIIKDFDSGEFYYNNNTPAVSLTSDTNVDLINERKTAGTLASLPKNGYVLSTSSHGDVWFSMSGTPGTEGLMEKVYEDNDRTIWVFYFNFDLEDGKYLTFWNRSQYHNNSDYNNIDNNVSFIPAVQYNKSAGNMWIIRDDCITLTDSHFNNCRIFNTGSWSTYTGEGGNTTIPGEKQVGQWGPPSTLPVGSYQTYFMRTLDSTATSVTATFEYYGVEYSVELTHSGSETRKFYSAEGAIPDDVTKITFTDNLGNTWTSATSGTRSDATNYYYATTNSTGLWSGHITPPSGKYKTYFVPPSGNTATTVTATYTYKGVEFSTTLTKGTNGYWATQSIPDEATSINFTDGTNTWKTGTGRTSTNCYYMASSNTAGEWGKPVVYKTIYLKSDSSLWDQAGAWFWAHAWNDDESVLADVKMTAVSGQSGLYSVEIPEEATNILFVRMNPAYTDVSYTGKWDQTVDLKIPSDSNTFTITSWNNGTWYEVEEPEPDPDPEPASNVLYLKPNTNWKTDNPRYAAYFFGGTSGTTWVSMTASDTSGVYQVTIPDGDYKKVIFCRMNPATTANNWDNKWDQTLDLTIPTDGKNLYTVKEGTWNKGGGTWSTK